MLRATGDPAGGVVGRTPADVVRLDYDRRTRRRIALTGVGGLAFLLDLAKAPVLRAGDGIRLEDGRIVAVEAAPERLLEITCADEHALARIAWHLGNRHLATEIGDRVIHIRDDHVIADMVRGLGAECAHRGAAVQPRGRRLRPGRGARPQPWAHQPQSRTWPPAMAIITTSGTLGSTRLGLRSAIDPTYKGDAERHTLARLMIWLSPAFPVGGFSYSHGLEWVVETGKVQRRRRRSAIGSRTCWCTAPDAATRSCWPRPGGPGCRRRPRGSMHVAELAAALRAVGRAAAGDAGAGHGVPRGHAWRHGRSRSWSGFRQQGARDGLSGRRRRLRGRPRPAARRRRRRPSPRPSPPTWSRPACA